VRPSLIAISLLLLLPGSAFALQRASITHQRPGFTVSTRTVYYAISGSTAADMRTQLDQLGPIEPASGKRYDGSAKWNFYWHFRYLGSPGRCRLTKAIVSLNLKYTIPRWQRPADASTTLAAQWNSFLSALGKHEKGHGAIAIAAGKKLTAKIRALTPRSTCSRLEATANRIGETEVKRTNVAEAAYDARTDHGATQGARFP
jgi:predicted secreted Zn-dependent protease